MLCSAKKVTYQAINRTHINGMFLNGNLNVCRQHRLILYFNITQIFLLINLVLCELIFTIFILLLYKIFIIKPYISHQKCVCDRLFVDSVINWCDSYLGLIIIHFCRNRDDSDSNWVVIDDRVWFREEETFLGSFWRP